MLILTIENIPGKEIKEIKGLVKGSTVRCKNIRERYYCKL